MPPWEPVKFLPAVLAMVSWGYGGLAGAVPPPPEQSSANCAAPTYASDQLVCADAALLALDRRMARLLDAASSAAPHAGLHWFEAQEVWFRRRSRCAFSPRHAACLKAAYRERIALLSALAGQASGQGHVTFPARCPGAPWGNGPVRLHETEHGALLVEDGRGGVLAIASARQPRHDWSPFLRIVKENGAIRLESSEGTMARCRVLRPQ